MHNADDLKKYTEHIHGHHKIDSVKLNTSTEKIGIGNLPGNSNTNYTIHSHAYRVSFLGGSNFAETLPDKALDTYNNYYIGNDKSKWKNCE